MFGKQQKRKHSALINSEEEEEGQMQNELEPEKCSVENDTSNNTIEATHGNLDEIDQQENSTHNMDNQSSSNSIAHLTEFMDSLVNEDQLESSTQPKRARFLPHSNAIFEDYNSLELPLLDIPHCIPPAQSPSSSSSTDINHSSSAGLTDSSNSLTCTSDRDLPESDNGSDDYLSAERFSTAEVHEVIDLSSPVLSKDVVDLTLEPNSPTRSNFVDLTSEAVEQIDSSPVIVSVNKIYERRSVMQPRPSCRFQVTPSCSSNQDSCTTDVANENHNDSDVNIEDVIREQDDNTSVNKSTSHGEIKKNEEKDQNEFQKSITCPICLDDAHLIKRKRQLSSTTCGHVFCDKCIKNAVKTQNRCPTCRKKLTLRQIHPLFL